MSLQAISTLFIILFYSITLQSAVSSSSGDLGSGDYSTGDPGSGDFASGDFGSEDLAGNRGTPLLIRSFPEKSNTPAPMSTSSTSEPTTNPAYDTRDLGSGNNPLLMRSFPENPAMPSTLATTDVTFTSPESMNIPSSILSITAVLGVISAILMMALIIIAIAYAMKRYRKRMRHYKRHHMYDLPKYIVKPPPLPPRKVFTLVNKSTFLESSSKEILITATESTFIAKNDYEQGDHMPSERYCKNENSEIQPDLSRHMYQNTMAEISGHKNETHELVLANSSSITEYVSEPITSQIATSDPQTNGSTSKDVKQLSAQLSSYKGSQFYPAESSNVDTTVRNTNDHESYEQVCTYKNVQPCDVEQLLRHINEEVQSQGSLVLGEASKNESDDSSGATEFTDLCGAIENTHDHESADSEHQSYEQVCSYENVEPCDVEDVLLHLNKEVQSQDPSVLGEASKKESSGDSTMDFIATKLADSGATAESCESDSEHESYEQVYSYEKAQSRDVEDVLLHLNKEAKSQDPSVFGEASKNEFSKGSGFRDLCTTIENTCDHESDSEHESYEKVCPYEKVQPCDVEHSLLHLSIGAQSSVLGEASNNNDTSCITEFTDLCTTVKNTCDSESDSEHESYEEVYSYEKVQPCDADELLRNKVHQQVSSVHCEASKKDYIIIDGEEKTETSLAESLNSYEQVWGYERIHCSDLLLEEFMVQKDDKGHT